MLLITIPSHDDQTIASVAVLWATAQVQIGFWFRDLQMNGRSRFLVSIYHVTFRIGDASTFLGNFCCDSACLFKRMWLLLSLCCFRGYLHTCNGRMPKSWCIFEKLRCFNSKEILQEVPSIICWRRGSLALSVVIRSAMKVSAVCKSLTNLQLAVWRTNCQVCKFALSLLTWWWTWDSASLKIEGHRTSTESRRPSSIGSRNLKEFLWGA